ncbi:uncharacterized protein LOC131147770 isoform X2 [Malania oleifera]|uniref:uncharacterized protein LOC131147770 isoform X2 n=1 Tax=Malania oleifera TaxID=397392 RepID=UPI0025AEB2D3|nr:uncharacterized protein LOC131147770 isoform X2 [Malania oleifera]
MVSREPKKAAAMSRKLQLLRSITNSHAQSKGSIISDASKYIEELKQKVERLNQDISTAAASEQIKVEEMEKGFVINVASEKSDCHGLLVFILEAFEELGLEVFQARVSCSSGFHLQALGGKDNNNIQGKCTEEVDAQMVKQAVSQAIQNWSAIN